MDSSDSIYKCGLDQKKAKGLMKVCVSKIAKNLVKFFGHFNWKKKKICKSIPNGLKRVKNTKPATLNFSRTPVPVNGSRPILPLDKQLNASDFQSKYGKQE